MRLIVVGKKKFIGALALVVALIAAVVAVCGSGAYKVAAGKTTRKLPIYCVDRPEKWWRFRSTRAGARTKPKRF